MRTSGSSVRGLAVTVLVAASALFLVRVWPAAGWGGDEAPGRSPYKMLPRSRFAEKLTQNGSVYRMNYGDSPQPQLPPHQRPGQQEPAQQQQQPPQQQQQQPAQQQQQKEQQQVPPIELETRVDIILVDVNVVDREGKPVEGLGTGDFKVSVNGRQRKIQTVQFITQVQPPPAAAAEPAPAPRVSSNVQAGRGRLFMLVVDETNINVGDARALDEPLQKFFSSLGPRDRVGLVTIPFGGPRIDFTSDSGRVRRALEGIAGMSQVKSLSRYNIGLAEAFYFESRAPQWNDVVARECRGMSGEDALVCRMDLEADAMTVIVDARQRATAALGALYDVIRSLRSVDGPKTVVLVSGGIVMGRDDALSLSIASEAAAANTTMFVLHLERPLVDASARQMSPTLSDDLALGRTGLEMVAGRARGDVFEVATSTEFALARIVTETSGYYLLGVEAEPEDRDGKTHQVRVELTSSRRGMTLRSRREFRYAPPEARGATDEERLGELLGAPGTVDDIPITVSTYTMGDPMRGKLMLHIAAEIGAAATAEETMAVGLVLMDGEGRPRATAGQRRELRPVDPRVPSPLHYTGWVWIEPGDYTMKLAVIHPDGTRGSIEHPVKVDLTTAGAFKTSDLFVLDAPVAVSIDFRPEVLTRVTGARVATYCEMYAADPSAFSETGVSVEIAANDDGPTLIGGKARPSGTEPNRRMVQVALSTSMLPPGDYVARVIFTERGEETARLVRGFRIEHPAAPAAGGEGTMPAPSVLDSSIPKPFFDRQSLLRPEALQPFLEKLEASSPLVAAAIDDAKEGRFEAILDAPQPVAPDVASSFLRGIALFARGDLNDAANAFRAALRESGDFFPAAFFLGACHAAAGHDTEAAGAWQTSLITLEHVPLVYEMLADALVRLGRYREASDILEEAASRFTGLESLESRRAAVALALGDRRGAFARVSSYLERHPEDPDALFLVIRLLYESISSGQWIENREADTGRMRQYVDRYAAVEGPHRALAEQWLKDAAKKKQ